jgi:hypothetical protein
LLSLQTAQVVQLVLLLMLLLARTRTCSTTCSTTHTEEEGIVRLRLRTWHHALLLKRAGNQVLDIPHGRLVVDCARGLASSRSRRKVKEGEVGRGGRDSEGRRE